jgi:hypothetical protein
MDFSKSNVGLRKWTTTQEKVTSRTLDCTQTRRIPQPKILEPGPRAQKVSNLDSCWTTTLPEDLVEEQATRLQLFYAVGVILWAINFATDIYLTPHGDRGPYRLLIEALEAAVAVAIAAYILDKPVFLPSLGKGSHHPTISRQGNRLVYSVQTGEREPMSGGQEYLAGRAPPLPRS